MKFRSTRDPESTVDFCTALERGIAPDGGLYVPVSLPRHSIDDFDGCDTLAMVAECLLRPFVGGTALAPELADICSESFSFPIPLLRLQDGPEQLSVLELFHGPTAAFKDVGARFLAASLERMNADRERPLTILVATSGDTGGAVAAAFHGRPNVRTVILYPLGLVSPRQEKQLTCWGGNVTTLAVEGSFDDCQRLVKQAFADPGLREAHRLSSANSISIGRLLPQTVYYALASLLLWRSEARRPGFIIPTGNLGNAQACVWARSMGLPIADVILATNANRPIPDFLDSGEWRPRDSLATLASAMDVGNPSNMERLRWQFNDDIEALRAAVSAISVEDAQIREQIAAEFQRNGCVWCPHTATAMWVYRHFSERRRAEKHWVVAATAHPAKFEEIVEPLIGRSVEIPEQLAALLELPVEATRITPELDQLTRALG
jgi:threonine synthase